MYFFIHYFFHGGDVMDYEINSETCAILPVDIATSKIVENSSDYVVNDSSLAVLEHSCEYFGSSYEGRLKATKSMIGSVYKAPIIVEESKELVFFPIRARGDSPWLSLKNIEKYEKLDNKCLVTFKSGRKITLDVNYQTFENQVLRAARLENIIHNRKNEQKKR